MDSTDEEDYWDEVEVPVPDIVGTIDVSLVDTTLPAPLEHDIEITLTRKGGTTKDEQEKALAKRQAAAHDRLIRLESHKLHTVALLASLSIRNRWLNDDVLKARLLSLVPLSIQHSFTSIKKSTHPDPARRGRLFETALVRLVDWFAPSSAFAAQNSHVGRPGGWFRISNGGHIKSHTFEAASERVRLLEHREAERKARQARRKDRRAKRARAKIKGKGRAIDDTDSSSEDEGMLEISDPEDEWYAPERLRSPNSIAKHALQRSGTRDMAAFIFVGIVRALGIPTRLVSSLQSVSWSKPKEYPSKNARGSGVSSSPNPPAQGGPEMEDLAISTTPPSRGDPSGGGEYKLPVATASLREKSTRANGRGSIGPLSSDNRKRDSGGNIPPEKRLRNHRQMDQSPSSADGSKPKTAETGSHASRSSNKAPSIKLRRTKPMGNILGAPPGESKTLSDGPPTFWAEVFSRPDGRWIPVDPVRGIVNRAGVFEERDKSGRRKTDKLMYVVAMEEDGYARDVTARYAKNFGAHQARARARVAVGGKKGKAEWWDGVMRILKRPYGLHRDDVEDAELSHQQAMEGLPASVGAFKDHPIYALERHLRKDEAIYPRTEIAHFRGEPVFPRRNVLSLKSADGWMRQGRRLREGVQPIKMSKPRASTVRKKRELEMRREQEGEVLVGMYAEWQTEVYRPPPVVDGKIPTNDFGNIDLYVPSMLPDGAIHIPHKGSARVARKLGIQFAEAVTGFEFRKRQATPIITGIVIAAENEQVFLEALASHTHAEKLKEAAKRQERVLQRWKRLVQGLRIVQRVTEQYSYDGNHATRAPDDVQEDRDGELEPGGFLDDLRDVVRPYNLPEPQAIVPKLRPGDDMDVPEDRASLEPLPDVADQSAYDTLFNALDADEIAESEDSIGWRSSGNCLGPPLTMQQLADQTQSTRAKATPERLKSPDRIPQDPEAILQPGTAVHTDDIDVQDMGKNEQESGAHEGDVRDTPGLRTSRRKRKAPSKDSDPPPTRTLRPRRKV